MAFGSCTYYVASLDRSYEQDQVPHILGSEVCDGGLAVPFAKDGLNPPGSAVNGIGTRRPCDIHESIAGTRRWYRQPDSPWFMLGKLLDPRRYQTTAIIRTRVHVEAV